MKLKEFKNRRAHCFGDSSGNRQGEYKSWYSNGQMYIHCHFKDDEYHGEYKCWLTGGDLLRHVFCINDKIVINFLTEPHEYPTTPEERVIFKLSYGTAPFLDEL